MFVRCAKTFGGLRFNLTCIIGLFVSPALANTVFGRMGKGRMGFVCNVSATSQKPPWLPRFHVSKTLSLIQPSGKKTHLEFWMEIVIFFTWRMPSQPFLGLTWNANNVFRLTSMQVERITLWEAVALTNAAQYCASFVVSYNSNTFKGHCSSVLPKKKNIICLAVRNRKWPQSISFRANDFSRLVPLPCTKLKS